MKKRLIALLLVVASLATMIVTPANAMQFAEAAETVGDKVTSLSDVCPCGGGQYLNACVWFEIITGQSCIGTSYVPTYEHEGEIYGLNEGITAEQLQNAAYQAVTEYKAEQEQ